MPIPQTTQEQLERLVPSSIAAPGSVVPKLDLPEFPPRVMKMFPELSEWRRQAIRNLEDWRVKLNITIQNL